MFTYKLIPKRPGYLLYMRIHKHVHLKKKYKKAHHYHHRLIANFNEHAE